MDFQLHAQATPAVARAPRHVDGAERDAPRMGSEYSDAQSYLARGPRPLSAASRPVKRKMPKHGANESDFGVPDQSQD